MYSGRQTGSPCPCRELTNACAFSVHILTATGAAFAFAALFYAVAAQWTAVFLCLGIALIIDGIDGTIARMSRWPRCCRDGRVTCSTSLWIS